MDRNGRSAASRWKISLQPLGHRVRSPGRRDQGRLDPKDEAVINLLRVGVQRRRQSREAFPTDDERSSANASDRTSSNESHSHCACMVSGRSKSNGFIFRDRMSRISGPARHALNSKPPRPPAPVHGLVRPLALPLRPSLRLCITVVDRDAKKVPHLPCLFLCHPSIVACDCLFKVVATNQTIEAVGIAACWRWQSERGPGWQPKSLFWQSERGPLESSCL